MTEWVDKTEQDIRTDIIGIAREETGLTNFKSTGVLRAFLEVLIRLVSLIYKTSINPIAKNTNLDTASGLWLSFMGLLVGVARKSAKKTQGTFQCKAWDTGKLLKGTWFTNDALGIRFKVVEDTPFQAGLFTAKVEAEFPGIDGNISPGTPMRATRVVNGLESITVPNPWITSLGTDDEQDSPYRERIKAKWRSLGEGNPPSRYVLYAMAVDGVASAKVIRTPRGYGSIDLIITSVDGIPTQALLDRVRAALNDYGLVCRDFLVRPPVLVPVSFSLEYAGDASPEGIEKAIRKYLISLGIGVKLEMRNLYSDPWESLAITSLEILSPVRDIAVPENGMLDLVEIEIKRRTT